MSAAKILCLVLSLIFFISLFLLFTLNTTTITTNFLPSSIPSPSNNDPSNYSSSSNTKEKVKTCIKKIAEVYASETYRFFAEMDLCMKEYFRTDYSTLDNFPNGATGERKVFLPMASEFKSEECRWLTIGIGGLVGAEEQIHVKYPNCKIYGVEPGDQGKFSKIGKVLSVGVGTEDSDNDNGLKVMALTRILDEFVHSRLIHYLSIDIESYEMIILQELVGGGKFANENITFCQIDAELHNPKQGGQHELAENINRVKWIINFLDGSSPYLPIFTVSYTPAHKVTFVNVINPECEKAFKISSFVDK